MGRMKGWGLLSERAHETRVVGYEFLQKRECFLFLDRPEFFDCRLGESLVDDSAGSTPSVVISPRNSVLSPSHPVFGH
jgi:hypothetical protein